MIPCCFRTRGPPWCSAGTCCSPCGCPIPGVPAAAATTRQPLGHRCYYYEHYWRCHQSRPQQQQSHPPSLAAVVSPFRCAAVGAQPDASLVAAQEAKLLSRQRRASGAASAAAVQQEPPLEPELLPAQQHWQSLSNPAVAPRASAVVSVALFLQLQQQQQPVVLYCH